MKCCISDVDFIRLLLFSTELFKFEIQKYGQILCVHKPYFLMPGHIYKIDFVVGYYVCMLMRTKHVIVQTWLSPSVQSVTLDVTVDYRVSLLVESHRRL